MVHELWVVYGCPGFPALSSKQQQVLLFCLASLGGPEAAIRWAPLDVLEAVLAGLQRVGHVLKEAPGLDKGGRGEAAALHLPVPPRLGLPTYTPRPTTVALRGHRLVCRTGAGANIREGFGGSAGQEGRKVLHTNSLRVEEFTLIARKISARAARLAEPPLHRRAPPVHLGGAPRPPVRLAAAGAVVCALGVPFALVDKGENAVLVMLIIVMIVLNGFTF